MEDMLIRIDQTNDTYVKMFEKIKEEDGIDVGIIQIDEFHFVELQRLFDLIDDLKYTLDDEQDRLNNEIAQLRYGTEGEDE